MRFLHLCFGGFLITAACSGSQGGPLDDGGTTNDATGGNDGTTASDAPTNPDVAPPKGDASKPDTGGACPDESGGYSIALAGAGCGDTSSTVSECIQQSGCTIAIDFGGGTGKGIKGQTPIQGDGSFSNAAMEEGSVTRTGCIGTWNNTTSTLVITCGGTSSTQSCIATLVRTSDVCK